MFRRLAVIAVTALGLAACSMPFGGPSAPPAQPAASAPGPAVTGTAPASRTGGATIDESTPLLEPDSTAASCPAACERSFTICMDSVAARPGTTDTFGATPRPFTATDDCQYDLGRCLRRCPSQTSP